MAYVKLLVDVAEGGRDLAKAQAAADDFGLGKTDPKYPRLKVTVTRRGRLEYRAGLIITMTDEGAAKWVERGIGEVVSREVAEEAWQRDAEARAKAEAEAADEVSGG
jgi:hypothetical protein